jgi:topoisomerase IV subunit A
LVIYNSGNYELTNFELTNRYPAEEIALLAKFNPNGIISAIYFDGSNKTYFIKRFKIETSTIDKKFLFISDHKASKLVASSFNYSPNVQIKHKPDGRTSEIELIPIDELVDVRGWKAIGSKLNYPKLTDAQFIDTEAVMPESEVLDKSAAIEADEDETIDKTTMPTEEVESSPIVEVQPLVETEETKTIEVGQTITLEEEPTASKSEDIPLEIKNYPTEQIPKDSSKGEQLGLF